MKKLLFGAAALFLMASCSSNSDSAKDKEETKEGATEVVNQEIKEESSPLADTVAVSENDIAAQQDKAALEQSARDFVSQMYAVVFKSSYYPVNNTYFTPDFVKLYNQTLKTESRRMAESDSDGGMDEEFFDDEFWSSYNDDPKSLGAKAKVTKVTIDENKNGVATATVIVKINPEGNQSPIKINLIMTDNGWKISDYRGFKKPMQRYLKS